MLINHKKQNQSCLLGWRDLVLASKSPNIFDYYYYFVSFPTCINFFFFYLPYRSKRYKCINFPDTGSLHHLYVIARISHHTAIVLHFENSNFNFFILLKRENAKSTCNFLLFLFGWGFNRNLNRFAIAVSVSGITTCNADQKTKYRNEASALLS